MNEEELLRQAASAPTMYFDGLGCFRNINGVLRCVGYVLGAGAQLNLLISLTGAKASNEEVRRLLEEPATKRKTSMDWLRSAH
jgi:hypothetical protein